MFLVFYDTNWLWLRGARKGESFKVNFHDSLKPVLNTGESNFGSIRRYLGKAYFNERHVNSVEWFKYEF